NGTEYDLGSILTHEAGHFLGLAHTADTSAVMYASYSPGATVLTPDDVAGICSIYPSDGTRETGAGRILAGPCNPAPPLGFLTACGSLDSGTLRMGMVGSGGPGVNQGSGDPGSSCPPDCAVGRAPGGGKADLWACGLIALSVLARLDRTLSRGRAGARIALGIGLITGIGVRSSDAAASVSVIATFEQLVQESSAVAVVTPTEQRALWEGDRIATYTHVRVDRRLAGDLEGDAWGRTLGGSVGDVAQIAEGQAIFSLGRPSLVFLRTHVDANTRQATDSYVVVERAQGQFPVVTATESRLDWPWEATWARLSPFHRNPGPRTLDPRRAIRDSHETCSKTARSRTPRVRLRRPGLEPTTLRHADQEASARDLGASGVGRCRRVFRESTWRGRRAPGGDDE